MIAEDKDALLCDLAETYHIYSLEALPLPTVATLACGLRGNARIMKKIVGPHSDIDTILKAGIFDRLSFIAWTKTKDAQSNTNRPESVVNSLLGNSSEKESEYEVFEDGDELLQRLEELKKGAQCQN